MSVGAGAADRSLRGLQPVDATVAGTEIAAAHAPPGLVDSGPKHAGARQCQVGRLEEIVRDILWHSEFTAPPGSGRPTNVRAPRPAPQYCTSSRWAVTKASYSALSLNTVLGGTRAISARLALASRR